MWRRQKRAAVPKGTHSPVVAARVRRPLNGFLPGSGLGRLREVRRRQSTRGLRQVVAAPAGRLVAVAIRPHGGIHVRRSRRGGSVQCRDARCRNRIVLGRIPLQTDRRRHYHRSRQSPYCVDAASRPITVPGTATARQPNRLVSRVTLPCASKYMSRVAAPGAVSRKLRKTSRLSARCATRKPPPPRLPQLQHGDPGLGGEPMCRNNHAFGSLHRRS
jgi:hypothetical protein